METDADAAKRYVVARARTLDRADLTDLGQFLIARGLLGSLREAPDGLRVNLDALPEEAIRDLFQLVKRRVERHH